MVGKISEEEARTALANEGMPATFFEYYEALRIRGGWVFCWREDAGLAPDGAISWVVADNGRCRDQPFWATAEETAQSLLEGKPITRPWE